MIVPIPPQTELQGHRFVVISGCSGGGKSTLLEALGRRGHACVVEPGRRIVHDELAGSGAALPWVDGLAFARRALAMAQADLAAAGTHDGWVFFDRGLVDAAAALLHLAGVPLAQTLGTARHYHRRAFLTPPWPAIYQQDGERPHGLEAAVAEYERLLQVYPALGYQVTLIPQGPVAERADFVLGALGVG